MLLTLSAALLLAATPPPQPEVLTPVPSRETKIVRRWSLSGDPHGLAIGRDGTLYVGLAQSQAVIAVDPKSGAIKKRVVLDKAEIAATKELVTLRTNSDASRLFIADGSDESAVILSLPDLGVLREITIEGEQIRDASPDPKGRYLYLLGRRVHVYDASGEHELHTIPIEDPMAIAASEHFLAVIASEDFGSAIATSVALYDTAGFNQLARDPLETADKIEGAVFSADEKAIVAISHDHLLEKPVMRAAKTMTKGSDGKMRMSADFGDFVNSDRICLPDNAGPQILTLAPNNMLLYAERRCNVSGAFTGSQRRINPASLYGVSAYALAYDRESNTLAVTDRAGSLTIYKVPRPVSAK
ncbi:MAG TPA: hypothetical protein VHU41_01915 [Thermoanaerobaculia bacterium]|nr:hypothetical protein [Thermoanaerobaculia bacterium]